mgnify:CR=1 FL=1
MEENQRKTQPLYCYIVNQKNHKKEYFTNLTTPKTWFANGAIEEHERMFYLARLESLQCHGEQLCIEQSLSTISATR